MIEYEEFRDNCIDCFGILALAILGCERGHRRPAKVYIPGGYIGWVRIEYGVQGVPKLDTPT